MVSKKRFGVSLPCNLADQLDQLAKILGTNRSIIVREAVKEYIHDHMHYMYPHTCCGIIIVSGSIDHEKLFNILEDYHDIIHSFNHVHLDEKCIEIIFVNGDSRKIQELHKVLMSMPGCMARYISVH